MARALVAALLVAVLGGCEPAAGPGTGTPVATPTVPVPMASLTPQVAATAAALQRGLGAAGFRLEHSSGQYRPGEPGSLRFVPRALFQVMLADPDAGWVVIYDLGTRDRATQAARDFVAYLQSGFGQTNFPTDAQFTVNQLDGTIFLAWWSRERSSEPERAGQAFETLRLIGQSYPIVR